MTVTPASHPDRRAARRLAARLLGVGVALQVTATGAVAHEGVGGGGGPAIGVPVVLALVAGTGVLAGVLAATGRTARRGRIAARWITRAVGPLLVGLGVLAVGAALTGGPAVGLVGLAVGGTVGGLLATRGGRETRVGTAVGAIAVHRLVEGATLAAATATGSTVGLLGAVVLAGHTAVECVAVGGTAEFGRRRAIAAVLFVVATFAVGVALGTLAAAALPTALRLGLLAAVGGLLVALGTDETRDRVRSPAA